MLQKDAGNKRSRLEEKGQDAESIQQVEVRT